MRPRSTSEKHVPPDVSSVTPCRANASDAAPICTSLTSSSATVFTSFDRDERLV